MGVLEAVLAVIGLATLVILVVGSLNRPSSPPPEEDVAAPYREGLHAAVRMQRVAQDLEARIYAEAASRVNSPSSLLEHQVEGFGSEDNE